MTEQFHWLYLVNVTSYVNAGLANGIFSQCLSPNLNHKKSVV